MIYKHERAYDITDYGGDKKLRLDAILKIFQELAVAHSAFVGYSAETYMGQGNIWLHNKSLFKINKLPNYTQEMKPETYSRSIDRFKGHRNYRVFVENELAIEGSSIWIYIDIDKKRPVRPTAELISRYEAEDIPLLNDMIKKYSIKEPDSYDDEILVALRPADFDVNGHVGNIVYAQLASIFVDCDLEGKLVGIVYNHEIPAGVKEVIVKSFNQPDRQVVGIYNGDSCAALLEVSDG